MSLEEAAAKIADRLRTMDYVEVYSHHDADGIASAAIIAVALQRADIAFRLRILPVLTDASVVEKPEISLLCDLGASVSGLLDTTMIIDHHVPCTTLYPYHINPRLEGLDGESELSAAGCAYLVANALGDNRDLAGLVMLGVIGDDQMLTGMNQTIIGEAIGNNLIQPGRGIRLPGRNTKEQVECAVLPYLPNLSGNSAVAATIETLCADTASEEAYTSLLLSEIVARSGASYYDLMSLFGDVWHLEREVIQDAHTFAAVVDACGKAGRADIGFAIASGDTSQISAAWDVASAFRKTVISAVDSAKQVAKSVWMVEPAAAASDVADVLVRSEHAPVTVLARADSYLKVSVRAPREAGCNLEQVMKSSAEKFGGVGGGHATRAGGEFPLSCEAAFIASLEGTLG